MHTQSLSCVLTLCDPTDCSPPGSSDQGILQARILEWVVISSSRGSFQARDRTRISCISCTAGGFFTHWAIRKAQIMMCQSRVISCDTCTTLMGNLERSSREYIHVRVQRVYWKTLCLPVNFAVNLKLLYKNCLFKKGSFDARIEKQANSTVLYFWKLLRVDLESFHHKKKKCHYMQWWI